MAAAGSLGRAAGNTSAALSASMPLALASRRRLVPTRRCFTAGVPLGALRRLSRSPETHTILVGEAALVMRLRLPAAGPGQSSAAGEGGRGKTASKAPGDIARERSTPG